MELNIKQSETADKLLCELIKNHRLDRECVVSFFNNKDEAYFVCEILSKERLINLIGPTEGAPFMFITPNEDIGIATFLDSGGGLSKIARDRENEKVKQSNRESKHDKVLDEFSPEQQSELYSSLDELKTKLTELGFGQQIIFDELDELKEHLNLGKKNWFQLLKGKLFDLSVSKVLEETIIKEIFKTLSDGFENIPKLIDNI